MIKLDQLGASSYYLATEARKTLAVHLGVAEAQVEFQYTEVADFSFADAMQYTVAPGYPVTRWKVANDMYYVASYNYSSGFVIIGAGNVSVANSVVIASADQVFDKYNELYTAEWKSSVGRRLQRMHDLAIQPFKDRHGEWTEDYYEHERMRAALQIEAITMLTYGQEVVFAAKGGLYSGTVCREAMPVRRSAKSIQMSTSVQVKHGQYKVFVLASQIEAVKWTE